MHVPIMLPQKHNLPSDADPCPLRTYVRRRRHTKSQSGTEDMAKRRPLCTCQLVDGSFRQESVHFPIVLPQKHPLPSDGDHCQLLTYVHRRRRFHTQFQSGTEDTRKLRLFCTSHLVKDPFLQESLHVPVELPVKPHLSKGDPRPLHTYRRHRIRTKIQSVIGDLAKRRSFCISHLINDSSFETYYNGSWHQTYHVSIQDGTISSQFVHNESKVEEKFHGNNLRLRSRKAKSSDCKYFLRPGIDVCVLSEHQDIGSSVEKVHSVLHDAKIVSIDRNQHESCCTCTFSVRFYTREIGSNVTKTTLGGEVAEVTIEQIAILQKLRSKSAENGYRHWNYSESCAYMHRSRLLKGTFYSAIAWLAVLSKLKGAVFKMMFIKNRIVFFVQDSLDFSGITGSFEDGMKVMNFQMINSLLQPKPGTLDHMLVEATPTIAQGVDSINRKLENESESGMLYDLYGLRRSKRQKILPDRFVCTFERNASGEPSRHKSSGSHSAPKEFSQHEESIPSQGDPCDTILTSRKCSHSETRSKRKVFLNSVECKKIIGKCTENIKLKMKKKPQMVFDWDAGSSDILLKETIDFYWNTPVVSKVEEHEYEDLWKEMDYVLATIPFLENSQELKKEYSDRETDCLVKFVEQPCKHVLFLDEEIGIVCNLCKSVITERRYILPSFGDGRYKSEAKIRNKYTGAEANFNLPLDYYSESIDSKDASLSSELQSIWSLIPELKAKLYPHQKKAFEFLWRNIGGSLKPGMGLSKKTGGCVISHSPGTGKTLLVVSFLSSYLRVFPRQHPLIIAPNITLQVWVKEFEKWDVSIPVYSIYPLEAYRKNIWNRRTQEFSKYKRRPNMKTGHALDCLEKLQKWHENPSVLLMSYSAFHLLTRDGSKNDHQKFIAEVLLKSPGILILDEGHNPRSTTSKVRKLLMQVKTNLRILLSGTLFQNNFEEYFNTLCLARPRFTFDVIKELKQATVDYGRINKKHRKKETIREELSRRIFIQEIGNQIQSSIEKEQMKGFEKLMKITKGFVDVYAGGTLNRLPGLEAYTIILNSSGAQKQILSKLQLLRKRRRSWELELMITVGSIHPWLASTIGGVDRYFDEKELEDLEKYKCNFSTGSKVKFVMDIVHKSNFMGEKVLIFCHNIPPITLLVETLEMIFGWHKGEEILVLQGDQDLFKRAETIDKFKDPRGPSRVLIASTTACSEGISLTAASRVVLMDSEWNHSKTQQAIARAFRPGQVRVVYVYQLLAAGTLEEEKYSTNERKEWLYNMTVARKYIHHSPASSSRKVEDIDDEMLKELVEGDQKDTFHMVMRH